MTPSTHPLAARRPVFDAHADSLQRSLDLGHDLGLRGPGHLDLVRGREGGLGVLVFVSWVDPLYLEQGPGGCRERTRLLLLEFQRLIARHPDQVRFAGNGRALAEARAAGVLAGIPGIEGGHSIEERLENLEFFFEHGVRVLTLVWNNSLSWVRSCRDEPRDGLPQGLSEFGREVVRTMNRLGMVVDLSHASRKAFYDALKITTKPVIASHSGCSALHDHPRNLDDDQLRALARNGGAVGIVFCTAFLDDDAQREDQRVRGSEAYRALKGENETDTFLLQSAFLQSEARPLELERVLDHLVHAVEVAGIDHVGLGSDYDGIQRTPRGLDDASCYLALADGLAARGLGEQDVLKVLGGNFERIYAEVTGPGTRAASEALARLPD